MKTIDVFTGLRNIAINLPDENFLYHALHTDHTPVVDQELLINTALDQPFGSSSLDQVSKDARVIIIVDDATRPTPSKRIIPLILERISKSTRNITFVTAPGTHRPLNDKELDDKIGRDLIAQYGVVNIDYKDRAAYVYLGETELGTPLHIHRAVLDAEYRIAIGNIAPHNVVGWSGGAKILQPGVSGEETTSSTHMAGSHFPLLEIFGNEHCRMRQEVDAIGERIGLDFIANTVLDSQQQILGLFCGHYLAAHRAGVDFAKKALCPAIPALADIVIVSAYPSNADYWQGFKPLGFSMFGAKKGGTIIFLFDPVEGLCGNSPAHRDTLVRYLKSCEATVRQDIVEGKITDLVGIANPLCHFQVLAHVKNIICVTNGLTDEECELLSFTKAQTMEQALAMAFRAQGVDAKVGIIPFGGETLVRLA